MTKEEKKLLRETHAHVTFLVQKVSVNGEKGIEPILRANYNQVKQVKADVLDLKGDVGDLKGLTEGMRAKRNLKKALDAYLKDRTFLKAFVGAITDKKFLTFIILSLLAWLGFDIGQH